MLINYVPHENVFNISDLYILLLFWNILCGFRIERMTNGKSSKRALRGDISTSTGSDTMSRDAESTEMAADQQAPDGGWGWMIVFAVFVGNFLIDGCAGSFGILYPELLEEFDASPAMTSMAGSLIVAVYLFSSKYGHRNLRNH